MFKDNNMDTRATSFMVSIVHGHSLFLINLETHLPNWYSVFTITIGIDLVTTWHCICLVEFKAITVTNYIVQSFFYEPTSRNIGLAYNDTCTTCFGFILDALYSVFTDIHSTFYSIRVSIYHIRATSSPQECYLVVLKDFFVDMIKHQLNLFIPIGGRG